MLDLDTMIDEHIIEGTKDDYWQNRCFLCGDKIEEGEEMIDFSTEWDCLYHIGCLIVGMLEENPEAMIIARNEWKDSLWKGGK